MKLLYITKISFAWRNAETTQVVETLENLSKLGVDALVLAPSLGRYWRQISFRILYLPTIGWNKLMENITFQLSLLVVMPWLIWFWRPDRVQCRIGPFSLVAPVIARIFGKKYVVEQHGFFREDLKLFQRANAAIIFISGLIEKLNYTLAKKVMVVTPELKELLSAVFHVTKSKIFINPNGANPDLFKPMDKSQARQTLGLDQKAKYALFVGNFAPWQGIDFLVNAVLEVRKSVNDFVLLLVGGGREEKWVRRLVQGLKIGNQVIFAGNVDNDKIPLYINAADVCVAPFISLSRRKNPGSPLKVYEYLACGKQIVVSNVGSVGALIRNGKIGILVEPENPESLAQGIIDGLLHVRNEDGYGEARRALILKQYNWNQTAKNLVGEMRGVLV